MYPMSKKYTNDIQADLICMLWSQLEELKHEIETGVTVTTPISTNTSCEYSDHSTRSVLLCEVWCEIEHLKGSNCVFCPQEYDSDPESKTLCQLWEDLINHQNSPESTTAANPTNDVCEFESNLTSADKLRDLWCQVQSFSGFASCPSLYVGDPEEDLLCELWSELQTLEKIDGSESIEPFRPVECVYIKNPTSSENLCDLWCKIQMHKGSECVFFVLKNIMMISKMILYAIYG